MQDKNDWTREELQEQVNSMTAVTIPVHMRIEGKQRIFDLSEMRAILKSAKLISIGECYCRKNRKKCEGPLDVCFSLDEAGRDQISKGLATKATLEQALDALKRSHEAGLVHVAYTVKGKEKPEVICSCCSCCCHTMSALVRFGMLVLS